MNEARVVRRDCSMCGKWFDVHLEAKKHWWYKRKINEEKSGGFFFGDVPLSRHRTWGVIEGNGKMRYVHSWWKRPFLLLWYRIEDLLDPEEMAEMWECNECLQNLHDSVTKRR